MEKQKTNELKKRTIPLKEETALKSADLSVHIQKAPAPVNDKCISRAEALGILSNIAMKEQEIHGDCVIGPSASERIQAVKAMADLQGWGHWKYREKKEEE
ncbi:hypothetical protein EZS27_015911 [termite gut metagenome]|uniref:Uncharacterized protein n=1 Tax=termite gut metagenome TaxID=433724 RepID=A0A5J4RQI5_9ZZZZ